MAQWKKAPEKLIRVLDDSMGGRGAERRTMFGYPVYFVNGNMFYGVFGDQLFLRLSPAQVVRFRKTGRAKNLEPMEGRIMKDYFIVPPDVLVDTVALSGLVAVALAHASTLAPKKKKGGGKKPDKA